MLVALLVLAVLCFVSASGERVASCNGHGAPYSQAPYNGACQCFPGYADINGHGNCQQGRGDMIYDTGGNPVLFQEFWMNSSLSTTGDYFKERGYARTPYASCLFEVTKCLYTEHEQPKSLDVQKNLLGSTIFALHRAVDNVDPTGYSLVYGAGATEMISAVEWAYSQLGGAVVTARAPYFGQYKNFASNSGIKGLNWSEHPDPNTERLLEFVTFPNNPDGTFRAPKYPKALSVYDFAYFWPSIMPDISAGGAPRRDPVMIFTLSKLTGYAGTRFGWALFKDAELAQKAQEYISLHHLHNSEDSSARSLQVLHQLLVPTVRESFFTWVYEKLQERKSELSDALPPGIKNIGKNPFYAWIQCKGSSIDCAGKFASVGVRTIPGSSFGGTDDFTRMEMVLDEAQWQLVLQRIRNISLSKD